MTRWQRRAHLWTWLLAALVILACAVLALDVRHRVGAALQSIGSIEGR